MGNKTLVVVANGSQARFFLSEGGRALQEVGVLHHKPERSPADPVAQPADIASRSKHNTDAHMAPQQKSRHAFAKAVADRLSELHNGEGFGRLYLIASPALLGELRQNLSGPIAALVVGEVNKDLTADTPGVVREHLPLVL
ncbi:MAG: host attachment protein [Parachlamydiales bacterium]